MKGAKKKKGDGDDDEDELEEDSIVGYQKPQRGKNPANMTEGEQKKKVIKKKNPDQVKKKKPKSDVKDVTVFKEETLVDVDESRDPVSLVFIGHVDAGKSTMSGNLMYSMGIVD